MCYSIMQLARIKSNGDTTFVLHERDGSSESSRVEGENTGKLTDDFGECRDGSSAPNDTKSASLRMRTRRRKGIPHRSPLSS